jgi:hypothetical protein
MEGRGQADERHGSRYVLKWNDAFPVAQPRVSLAEAAGDARAQTVEASPFTGIRIAIVRGGWNKEANSGENACACPQSSMDAALGTQPGGLQ